MSSVLWMLFNKLPLGSQNAVPTSRPDFSNSQHCNIGGLSSRKKSTPVPKGSFHTRTRPWTLDSGKLCVNNRTIQVLYRPRAHWVTSRNVGDKRSFVDSVDLDRDNETAELNPPTKKPKMESKNFFNGSVYEEREEIQIVHENIQNVQEEEQLRSINRKNSISKRFRSSGLFRPSVGFALKMEAAKEDKRKYSELLNRYYRISRDKTTLISQRKVELALANLDLQPTKPKSIESASPVIDLTEEEETRVVPTRVQVNRQRSVTPVTQATEKPDLSAKTSMEKTKSSNFFSFRPSTPFIGLEYLGNFKLHHDLNQKSIQEAINMEEIKSKALNELNGKRRKARKAKRLEDLQKNLKEYCVVTESFPEEAEVEVVPPLPELTDEMQRVVSTAVGRGNPSEVLVEAFNLRILRRDIQTLQGLNWLNDEVINFYMNLLMDRGKQEKYPSVYAFNTFFYPKLINGGQNALKRWTKKVDIFSYDFVVAPVHLGVHWCMAIIDMGKKTIMYFDSMGGRNEECLKALRQYLCDEKMDKKKEKLDIDSWEYKHMKGIPQQMNGSDCGMFSCMYAEYTTRRASISFTQQDMPYFRRKMIYEIIKVKLLC